MSEPTPLAQLLGPDMRTCAGCRTEKPATREEWPHQKGKPIGRLCRPCSNKEKDASRARREAAARVDAANNSLAAQPLKVGDMLSPKDEAHNQAIMQARAELAAPAPGKPIASRLEIAHALKQGAHFLNAHAPGALATLAEYLEDKESPMHTWALQLVIERALPRKLYEELGATAAEVGGAVKERPTFIVNVLPAGAQPPAGFVASAPRVIDVTPTLLIEEQ